MLFLWITCIYIVWTVLCTYMYVRVAHEDTSRQCLHDSTGVLKGADYAAAHLQKSRIPSSRHSSLSALQRTRYPNDSPRGSAVRWYNQWLMRKGQVCGLDFEYIWSLILYISFMTIV
jgi:hypothetical protein